MLHGHSDWVRTVAWAPAVGVCEEIIASGGQDLKVIIWKKSYEGNDWGEQIMHVFNDMIWHVSWSLMGNVLAVSCGDNKVSLWKQATDHHWDCLNEDVNKSLANEEKTAESEN